LSIRRAEPELGDGPLHWRPSDPEVLAFTRGSTFTCIVNFGADPVALPSDAELLIASTALEGGRLPRDATAWLRVQNGQ
jgi:alpha-glucosidase